MLSIFLIDCRADWAGFPTHPENGTFVDKDYYWGTCACSTSHVRDQPGSRSRRNSQISQGDVVKVIAEQKGWTNISYNNGEKEGWTPAECIKYLPKYSGNPFRYVTKDQMKELGWEDVDLNLINRSLQHYQINNIPRVRHFMTQVTYASKAGKYFLEKDGKAYEKKPAMGNIFKGDGERFRGAGYLMIRGRYQYESFERFMNGADPAIMNGAEYVAKHHPWMAAGFVWTQQGMNQLADSNNLTEITRRLDPKLVDLEKREALYEKALEVFQ